MNSAKKLTICVTFCDKDFHYIESLIEQIKQYVLVPYDLLLVDNRENNHDYLSFDNLITLKCNGQGCFIPRKSLVDYINSDYVWYIDADDSIIDYVTEDMFESNADVITFDCINDYGQITIGTLNRRKDKHYKDMFNVGFCVRSTAILGPTLWNKFIRTSIFSKIKNIPNFIGICQEDTFVMAYLLKYIKTVRCIRKTIYQYHNQRGDVKSDMIDIDKFKRLCKGSGEIFKLIPKLFTKQQIKKMQIWLTKESTCFLLLKLIQKSDADIVQEEMKLLLQEFTITDLQNTIKKYLKY